MKNNLIRCGWANSSPLEAKYHDTEWGTPLHDDRKLFELLLLEGKQAGLSWNTILHKRESMRKAFDNFNPAVIAKYDDKKIEELMKNEGIIRNRLKINAAIINANLYFELKEKYNSLDNFLWSYVDHEPILNSWADMSQVPASTPLSDAISKDLKKMGFKFVGSTIIYAFLQASGIVNDHMVSCFKYPAK